MKQKVWLVEVGMYSDAYIIGAYSTEELANKRAAGLDPDEGLSVLEYDLDVDADHLRNGLVPVQVWMDREGNLLNNSPKPSTEAEGAASYKMAIWYETFAAPHVAAVRVDCWARSHEHAIKIANEQRIKAVVCGDFDKKAEEIAKRAWRLVFD